MEILDLSKDYDWVVGDLTPWWGESHKTLDYLREPFNNSEDVTRWRSLGYMHEHFTGELYDMKRREIDWMRVDLMKKHFNFDHLGWAFYKMTTGVILPTHVDTFKRFKELFDSNGRTIVRALVMLEDWKPGHYLEVDGTGITNWKAGDYAMWTETCPHAAANIGLDSRYTLQITGLLKN